MRRRSEPTRKRPYGLGCNPFAHEQGRYRVLTGVTGRAGLPGWLGPAAIGAVCRTVTAFSYFFPELGKVVRVGRTLLSEGFAAYGSSYGFTGRPAAHALAGLLGPATRRANGPQGGRAKLTASPLSRIEKAGRQTPSFNAEVSQCL